MSTPKNLMVLATSLSISLIMFLAGCCNVREAANRSLSQNNLKHIGVGIYNYAGDHQDKIVPQAITDRDGRPLLSWRVAILPYIEQQRLYKRFKLDESWDSPHNIALLAHMPRTYRLRSQPEDATNTYYQVLAGRGTLFDPALTEPLTFRMLNERDGISNMILVVEAATPVPWTKPEDVRADGGDLKAKMGFDLWDGRMVNVVMADASVRAIHATTEEQELRKAAWYNDGQILNLD